MKEDPIVKDTRMARAKLFKECDQDLDKLMDRFKASEQQDKDRVVTIEDVRRRRHNKVPTHLPKG